jgi:galactarate dehydratase
MEAPGAEIPIRTFRHISTHPNLGGTPLVVSLGCEKLQTERLFPGQQFAKLLVYILNREVCCSLSAIA